MNKSISNKLTRYLAQAMSIGMILLAGIALVYSNSTYRRIRAERYSQLQSFADSILPDASRDMSNANMDAIRIRNEFIVLREKKSNVQLQFTDNHGELIYQSDGFEWPCKTRFFDFQKFISLCIEVPIEYSGGKLGTAYVTREMRSFSAFVLDSNIPFLFFMLIIFLIGLLWMFRILVNKEVVQPLNQLIRDLEENRGDVLQHARAAEEWHVLQSAIDEYKDRIFNFIKKQNEISRDLQKEKLMSEVTAQLAHDIRSPLAALDSMAASMQDMDEKKRLLIRNATSRIHNIANNLLDRTSKHDNELSLHMFSSVIRSMVFEKREQYKSSSRISIHDYVNEKTYGAFAKIQINDFKRMMSNIIDNAVQAIAGTGFVRVALSQTAECVVIEVFDNGKGIPEDLVPRIADKGITTRKDGNGLGLYFVNQKMKAWGGRLEIESKLNHGTTVRLVFNKEPAPPWFVSEVIIDDEREYVVLDDDYTIHQMWDSRILQVVRKSVKIRHFEDEHSFAEWFLNRQHQDNTTYFFDYELIGSETTGLDIIENFNINNNAILITSHYEDEQIQRRCERLGVRMIPKELAGYVPILYPE